MKVHNFFKKNLSFLVVFVFCCAVMPQVRAQSLVGTWSDLLTELANPSVTVIQLTDTIEVPAGTHSLTSAAGGTVIYPMADSRHFLIPSGIVEMIFSNVILDGGWDGVSDTYIGGGIEITGVSTEVTLNNANIQYCHVTNSYGGGIYNSGSVFTLHSCNISHNGVTSSLNRNGAEAFGGGVYSTGSVFSMNGGTINYNKTNFFLEDNRVGGGGVAVRGGKFEMNAGATISGNKSPMGGGGGVFVYDGVLFTLWDGTISGNTSHEGGGVGIDPPISGVRSTFTINGGEISGNIAECDGGGICLSNCKIEMNAGVISGNSVNTCGGGGGVVTKDEFIMKGGEISGNTAISSGGVRNEGTFIMEGGKIRNNRATIGGGVLNSGIFIMEGGEISGNKAILGGGVATFGGTFTMSNDAVIKDNTADFANLFVEDVINILKSALQSSDEYVDNIRNIYDMADMTPLGLSTGGGGVLVFFGSFAMTDGTVINNSAPNGDGGGIYTMDYNNVTISSSAIFSGNTARQAYRLELSNDDSIYNPGVPISAGDLKNLNLVPNNVSIPSNIALSAPPSGDPFKYAYNNYDINYTYTGTIGDTPIDTVCFTDSVTLAVTVIDGGESPTYQWFRNGVAVDDSNDSIFKYKAVAGHKDTILCKVYPDIECPEDAYSQIMIIEMLDSLALEQPDNDEVCVGEKTKSVTFSGTYDYVKWEVTTGNGLTIGMPANSGTGDISSFTTTNSGIVTITATPVSGKCEGISKTFTITVNPKQKIKATIKVR